jgi:hypothetical protein
MVAALAVLALVSGPAIGIGSPAGAAGPASYQITGVSCVSATFCMAVGSSARRSSGVDISGKTLVERWNGTRWSTVASPTPTDGKGAELLGVSCTSTSFCVAVGHTIDSSTISPPSRTFVERWNGTKWSIVASPNPASGGYNTLNGVSCTSTSRCIAVGGYLTPDGRRPTLVEQWNGTEWSILASPNPEVGAGTNLSAVSCPSATNCFAAGLNYVSNFEPVTMVEHWNGQTWSVVTDNRPTKLSALNGVACASPTNCTAVGYSQTVLGPEEFGPPTTLVQHWNGTTWSNVKSPNPGPTNSQLTAVSCMGTDFCIAVGQYSSASALKTFVLRWNGTKWSNITSPNPTGSTASQPAGVSCRSTTNCVAVGHYTTSTDPRAASAGPFKTLFQQWDGTRWTIVNTPTPPAP